MTKKINMAAIRLKVFIDSVLHQERGAVDIVAILILIAVAVVLAIAFKKGMGKVITDMITEVAKKASGVFGEE